MRKVWDLVGRPVLDMSSGMQLGFVREVVLDLDRTAIFCVFG